MGKNIFQYFKKKKPLVENKTNINLLTPKIFPKEEAKEKFKYYFEKLHRAIHSNDATNIAITGSYGSGKTTFIKNYQNVYDQKETGREYLNISLATFSEEDFKNKKNSEPTSLDKKDDSDLAIETKIPQEKKHLERLIELSILQQILYHVEPSQIPNSNLKRIRSIKPVLLIGYTLSSILWLYATTVLFKFNHVSKINPNNFVLSQPFDWFLFVITLIFIAGLSYLIYRSIRLFNGTKISKLKFLESELELGRNVDKSILNEHLDEIIYFFQNTNYDVVVFEDIDRFENTEIFTKLREINLLLNKSKQINRVLGKIVFIYAVRDDKFKNEERTKFFDYIIPIIPFISPNNANEQLSKLITQEGLTDTFTQSFIDDVVTFIDDIDMRLLINIFNEFLIYKSKLFSKDHNKRRNDNLLAIIIYKNLYPNDFAQLPKRKGNLYKIISQKEVYIKNEIKIKEHLLKGLKKEYDDIIHENHEIIEELRAVYINMIHKKIPDAVKININNAIYNFSDLLKGELFDKLRVQNIIEYEYYTHYNQNFFQKRSKKSLISFKEIEEAVNVKFNYDERVELLENKTNWKTTDIKKDIEKLKKEILEIETWELSQIYQELSITPDTTKFDNSRLIRYLLLEGYINENYNHYISLFHAENLDPEDFDFEKMVKSGENSPFGYELKRLDNLIKKLNIRFFDRPATLNYYLLNYLLENQQIVIVQEKTARFIKQLSNEKKRTIGFIDSYISFEEKRKPDIYDANQQLVDDNNIKSFINLLCQHWEDIWVFITKNTNFSDEKTKKYIKYIIQFAGQNDLDLLNKESLLSSSVEALPDFLTLFNTKHQDKVKTYISSTNIKFEALQLPNDETKHLFDFVYENNHYKINLNNISVILKTKYKDELTGMFHTNNLETVLNSDATYLIEYIKTEINEYVKNAYLKTEKDSLEKEQIFVEYLLNNTLLSIDLKIKILDKTKTVFTNLNEVENFELKKKILESNKVAPTWENIYSYLSSYDSEIYIDSTLIEFYNNDENSKILSEQALETKKESLQTAYRSIRYAILKCDELTTESYSNLLLSNKKVYDKLDFEHLSKEKIQLLLDKSKLNYTEENYRKLKNSFINNEHLTFLEKHQNSFIKKISLIELDTHDLTLLLISKKFNESNKLQLIKNITEDVLESSSELSKAVLELVLEHHYLELSFEAIQSIFSHSINTELKIKLLLLYKPQISKDDILTLISLLSYSYKRITTKSQTTIPVTETNTLFIQMLQEIEVVGKAPKNKKNEYRLYMKQF